MQQTILKRLKLTLILASIVTVLSFTAIAQMPSATDSRVTLPVRDGVSSGASFVQDDCAENLKTAEQRLLKTLDALAKAEALVAFKDVEIESRKRLDDLKNQILAVKDLIIAEQDKLIQRLQKKDTGILASLKRILRTAEKILLVGIGVYVGKGI